VGEIAKALDVHVAFLPSINILPWLNWGRGQESYGEDPIFSGKMGAAAIRGVQSQGVMATAKHFLANNIENTRWYVSAEFDDKTLHEVYLKQWAIVVAESSPEFVMTSYNRVQGKWANQDPRFIRILRERLGFEGSITTDWWATMEKSIAGFPSSPYHGKNGFFGNATVVLTAGVDLEMPFCNFNARAARNLANCSFADSEACQAENVIDRAVGHLLRSKLRYGLVGDDVPPKVPIDPPMKRFDRYMKGLPDSNVALFDVLDYRQLALKIAEQGMVLLKNEGSLLPKPPQSVSSVVAMGTPEILEPGDLGSSAVRPSGGSVSVLDGLRLKYGKQRVSHIPAVTEENREQIRAADLVVLDVGLNYLHEGEFIPPSTGGDRMSLSLLPHDLELIANVSALTKKVVVVITAGQAVLVEEFVDSVSAIIWIGYPGPLGGKALARILSGEVNPSGRMTSATPRSARDFVPAGVTTEPWAAGAEVQYPYSHGFKHMWGAGIEPRYPMGWGLSYTTFDHGGPTLRIDGVGSSALVTVSVVVRNSGLADGIETVQVFATCRGCKQTRQPIVLVGFARVALVAGASQAVDVAFSAKELAVYSVERELWLLEQGTYTVLEGPCADRRRLQGTDFTVEAEEVFDYPGPSAPPDVPGAGARACGEYHCQPNAEFQQREIDSGNSARLANLTLVIGLLLISMLGCCCCCKCLCRCGRKICSICNCGKTKLKQS